MRIALPENVSMIIRKLNEHGFEAYAVGGCIRDSVMGRNPHDWDITTSARPLQVKAIFKRTVDTGIKHGTVTVLAGDEAFEVTTYRIDGEYKDGRHPENVEFVSNLFEDLKRRDFTINAMAYNETDSLVDPFGGKEDIERRLIRCVGDAKERFTEDALRIMRAIRFSAQLSFDIDEKTKEGIKFLAMELRHVSAERISDELMKLLLSTHPDYLQKAYELGVTEVVLPEFDRMMQTYQNNPYHRTNVGEHTLKSMNYVESDRVLRLTMLLHDVGKPLVKTTDIKGTDHFKGHSETGVVIAKRIMKRLRLDNDTIGKVCRLIAYHDWRMSPDMKHVRRAMSVIGEDLFPYFIKVQYADIMAHSDHRKEYSLRRWAQMKESYERIVREGHCVSLKTLNLKGKDVLQLGCKSGVEVGVILKKALDKVIEDPKNNDSLFLKNYAKSLIENIKTQQGGAP